MMDVTETYLDVLQNIEAVIAQAYDADQTLLDLEVLDAFDELIRRYSAEVQGKTLSHRKLLPRAEVVYEGAAEVCEWRLGRGVGASDAVPSLDSPPPLPLPELLACLKRLRKSARYWNEHSGRQGYLEYICHFLP